ncbi:MAG TPA: helix-turn-helix transcriptional regulator [Candidatus Eisenbacteria bacterium]|nr:helix-turn-helix transcriptional regulator [Candidatus Eisenbacteria bacterium]
MPRQETLGERIRRLRQQRGLSLAKVSGEDFSRAFLNQVEMGRSQPSTRVLRVIAGRLGTEVDYLLEGRPPNLDRELALERARILVARGQARRALSALAEAVDATDWQLRADVRLCQAEALRAIGSSEEADAIIAEERRVITAHRDAHRLDRLHALERGRPFSVGRGDTDAAVRVHLRLADRALRAARGADALEHYRAARVLLEV